MGRLSVLALGALGALGCAGSPDTVVHVSAPHDARWEVRDADGEHVCSLPCSVGLDEEEAVSIVRADGRTRFVVRQRDLGDGTFSASVRPIREPTRGALAARAFAAALSSAGSVLAESDDREQAVAGVFLAGVGAVARIASEASEKRREELWVQRSASR